MRVSESFASVFTTAGRRRAAFHGFVDRLRRHVPLSVVERQERSVSAKVTLPELGPIDLCFSSFWPVVDCLALPGLRYPLNGVPKYLGGFLLHRNHEAGMGAWRALFTADGCTIACGQVIHTSHVSLDDAAWAVLTMFKEVQKTTLQIRQKTRPAR